MLPRESKKKNSQSKLFYKKTSNFKQKLKGPVCKSVAESILQTKNIHIHFSIHFIPIDPIEMLHFGPLNKKNIYHVALNMLCENVHNSKSYTALRRLLAHKLAKLLSKSDRRFSHRLSLRGRCVPEREMRSNTFPLRLPSPTYLPS